MRGENQSTDTKYATTLISEALAEIRSGRITRAESILEHALVLLPKVCSKEQDEAELRRRDGPASFKAYVVRGS